MSFLQISNYHGALEALHGDFELAGNLLLSGHPKTLHWEQ